MIPIEVLQYTIILYAISFIIVIAGFYVDFEGETLEEFKTYLFTEDMGTIVPTFYSNYSYVKCYGCYYISIIGIYRLIILPLK